jgi:SecD/SecF fusion protein
MNRSHFYKLLAIVVILAWAIYSMYPPTTRPVIEVFKEQARTKDTNFNAIVQTATELEKEAPERGFLNLRQAVGTNDITQYFPQWPAKNEKDPNAFVLRKVQEAASGKIKLGLDLRGGSSFLVAMDTNQLARAEAKDAALKNAVEVLRKRVDKLGVAEPVIQESGEDRILIQLPGLTEAEKDYARQQIEKAAFLEFRMVHPNSDEYIAQGIIEPGYEVMVEERKHPKTGESQLFRYLVSKKAERGLTGKYLTRAIVVRDQVTNKPQISFELNSEGARIFGEITTEYQPKGNKFFQLAIVLDGELQSAPQINEPILGGSGVISGSYTLKQAYDLAYVLENPLEAPVKVIEERTVGPSLGKDSIRSGVIACIYSVICVAAFMTLFYFFGGIVANLALLLNVVITVGVMCALGATLTLPGIAGLVLSIGMAVDANVLIFERLREEIAAGKPLRSALAAGYKRAFGTILDSHVTTLISAFILYKLGTGPIKGFGVTLTVGVAASLFTALVVTRLVFDFLMAKNLMKSLPMMPVLKLTKVDFLKYATPAFILSILIIVGGLGYGIFGRGKEMLGVDFAGGDSLTLQYAQKVAEDKLRAAIGKLGVESTIQYQKPIAAGRETLQIVTSYESGAKVGGALQKEFPDAKFQVIGTDRVGPTVGKEIQRSAAVALLLAMAGILVYVAVRYEFSFAVAAVIATIHDALFTLGIFMLAGGQFSAAMVAAVLTIVGYSINDKIVILDRIREDLKMGVRGSFREVINLALNQTLSRTLITGGSVILATLCLYVFGGPVINDFAFTFLVGILAGTYSSIYIASYIVLKWNKGERPRTGARVTVEGSDAIRAATKPPVARPAA